ncbi:MAG: glycosyltransferase family 39 protein [Thermodesulfobacteriota bacterium]|nr:glycosyltransferase family 39 protein [Thermodesulfobacteriota bacterium]
MKTAGTSNRSGRTWVWILIALLAIGNLFAGLGRVPFIDRDEGEYATVAQEMIQRSDYIIPHVNGRPYYEKPALFFWLMAASFKTLGQSEEAGRLPSALSGLALALVLGWFGRRRGGELLGFLSALMTLTCFLIVLLARVALLDMLLTLWTTLTLVLFFEGYQAPKGRDRWYFLGAWTAMGLAFLTKGPVGAAVPLLAVFFLTVLNRNLVSTLRRAQIPLGLLIFLAVAGPWYLSAFIREGRNFWEGFFISQNVTRFTEVLLGHGAPLWFYLPILAFLVWPWSFFACPAMWRGLSGLGRERNRPNGASLDFFLAIWFISVFLLFSAAATKQPNYILPAVPPLILLAARWWHDFLASDRPKTGAVQAVMALTGLVGLGLAGVFFGFNYFLSIAVERARAGVNPDSFEYAFPALGPDMGQGPLIVGLLIAVTAMAAMISGLGRRPRAAMTMLALSGTVFIGGMWHVAAPKGLDYLQTPARELAFMVKEADPPEGRLAAFGLYKPSLWFYTGSHIERIRSKDIKRLAGFLSDRDRVFVLSRLSLLPILKARNNFHLLEVKGGYVLGDNQARPAHTVRGEAE